MDATRTIFFVGKPGCGKGTQAKILSEATGWPVIAAGDLFRAIAKEDSLLGRKTKEIDEKGLLQPYWFAVYLYLKSLFGLTDNASVIFDGFNRTPSEAQLIVDSLGWLGRQFMVIEITVSDETMRTRLEIRHTTSGRADDAPVVINERIQEYREFTEPAIEVFRKEGRLISIDGEKAPEEISQAIRIALVL